MRNIYLKFQTSDSGGNTETGEMAIVSEVSLGLFSISNETTIDSDGSRSSNQYLNLSIGISGGVFLGIDLSGSIGFKLNTTNAPDEVSEPTKIVQDNTKVYRTEIPIPKDEFQNN